MTPVIFGLLTALCWGSADVLARFTGRALGAQGALFAMMLAGSAGLTLWIAVGGQPWPGIPSWWTLGAAVLAATSMLLFYEAMRRGPVSLVSPAVGAYPAWAVLISMALGVRPPVPALAAMALTMGGVFLVARLAVPEPDPAEAPGRGLTLTLALIASVMFGFTLLAGQQAIVIDGETHVLWWGRSTAALLMAALLILGPRMPRPDLKSGLLAVLQGGLDTLGLVFLFAAGRGVEGAMAAVSSSAFGVVTVLLARLLYKERLSVGQAGGILCVVAGVMGLAALG
jgi:drug/metabolite transporter (DMT)-like permease